MQTSPFSLYPSSSPVLGSKIDIVVLGNGIPTLPILFVSFDVHAATAALTSVIP